MSASPDIAVVDPVTLGPVRTDPAGLRPVRLLLLAVKAHQTGGAAGRLGALADSGTIVLVLQTGVDQRSAVSPLVRAATVVPAVVWTSAEAVSADRVVVRDRPRLTLPDDRGGREVARPPADTDCVAEVAADYERQAWRKLAENAVSGLTALAGRRRGRRPLESEARNRVIRRHGAALGVPTPISDVVVPLLAAASGDR